MPNKEQGAPAGARGARVELTPPVAQTPTQQILSRSGEKFEFTDALGRQYVIKKPGPLAQARLMEGLKELSGNVGYLNMAIPLLFIVSIDGEPPQQPTRKSECEALWKVLGDEGMDALTDALINHFGKTDEKAERDAIKN